MSTSQTLVLNLDLSICGLGFTIAGGADNPTTEGETAIAVQHIHDRGAAKAAGLQAGDKIISVNGTSLIGATHTQAVETIRAAIPAQLITLWVNREEHGPSAVPDAAGTDDDGAACHHFEGSPDPAVCRARWRMARRAYRSKDADLSRIAHELDAAPELHKAEEGQYIKAAVFGGLDGIITTFAVVASVTGANLSTSIVIIMGFANLVGDGLSMGVGEYMSAQSELQYAMSERNREEWEFDCNPAGEVREMVDLYQHRGFTREDAVSVIGTISKHRDFFIDHMMVEELGLMPPDTSVSPARKGLVMFLAFVAFGIIPLLSYLVLSTINFGSTKKKEDALFAIACALTAVALFALGAVKSRFIMQPWYVSGLTMLLNGGLAATAAFLVGYGLDFVVADEET